MPLTTQTTEGLSEIPAHQIQAVVRNAERRADLTAAALEATGPFPERPAFLPAGFLLELSAVLELGLWEWQGVRSFLNSDLPTFREAADALLGRANRGSDAFSGPDVASLYDRVLQIWIEQFAWDSDELLETDIVLGKVDEDQFVELMVQFVWRNRRELSKMLVEHREPRQE